MRKLFGILLVLVFGMVSPVTMTIYACETSAPTDICINARSISFADGIITVTYVNVDTGEVLNFHPFIQEFPIIITDGSGRTMCMQMRIDSLNPMGYSGLFDGVLTDPIVLTNAPSPYQYDVVRVDRTYGGAIDWAFSAGDFRAALERINFRIYLRPNDSHHLHTSPEQPALEVVATDEEGNLPIARIEVSFSYRTFSEGADIQSFQFRTRPMNIDGIKVGLYHDNERVAYAVSQRRTYFGGGVRFVFPHFYQGMGSDIFVNSNLTLADIDSLSVRIIDGAGYTWISYHEFSARGSGRWTLDGVMGVSLSASFWTSASLEAVAANVAPNNQPSSWAQEGVSRAIALGLVPSALQTVYTQPTTRAEFAALAVALYEAVTDREIIGRMQFNDTNDINVQKMGYLGVVTGVGNGSFAPNDGLTREQAAVMLARLADAMGQPLPSSVPTFADNVDISSWAVSGVGQMQAAAIMGGVGNNQFSPRGDYTREQSIITILRLFDILN